MLQRLRGRATVLAFDRWLGAGHVDDVYDDEFLRGLHDIEDHTDQAERDARAADALFVQLAQHPVSEWQGMIAAHPTVCTAALVQRLLDASTPELDRGNPQHALLMLRIAELVAFALDDVASLRYRGHVWKQRSNALRRLARYTEAIDAAIGAERHYSEMRDPDTNFEIGQARYTMAAALFKMTRYDPALERLASARALLDEYGISVPLAKVMMLEALIRIEQGNVAAARDTLRKLLPIEESLGQQLEVGRVQTNLAECDLRLGDLNAAMDNASEAIETFRALGNFAEETRSEWTVTMIRLAQGEPDAIERLHEIAAVFRRLGMPGESGFVNLDVTAELLRRGEWTQAETLALELVTLFSSAGVTLASVNALHYLRSAVENREATATTVRYIRAYIAADDPARPFEPPTSLPS